MLRAGLVGLYPALFAYLISDIAQNILAASLTSKPREYAFVYSLGQLITWITHAWITAEIFERWNGHYPRERIGLVVGSLLGVLVLAGALVAVSGSRHDYAVLSWADSLRATYSLRGSIEVAFAIIAGGAALFFRKSIPVATPPNLIRHTVISVALFVGLGIVGFGFNYRIGGFAVAQGSLIATRSLCFIAWAVAMRRNGEAFARPTVTQEQADLVDERMERLRSSVDHLKV